MVFNEDDYRDRQLNKYLEKQEGYTLVSNCCGAEIYDEDSTICPECKEHCKIITQGDYDTDLYEQAMEDKADALRDERLECE